MSNHDEKKSFSSPLKRYSTYLSLEGCEFMKAMPMFSLGISFVQGFLDSKVKRDLDSRDQRDRHRIRHYFIVTYDQGDERMIVSRICTGV